LIIKDYIVEKDPIINKFLPKDRGIYFQKSILEKKVKFIVCFVFKVEYNCAYLNVGIIDAVLNESNFVSILKL
jgi:hypothetical protein